MSQKSKKEINIYLSYSYKDEALKQEFEDYLGMLQQGQLIAGWVERQVQSGTDWSQVIDPRLLEADIFLVFLSPSLFASGYCSGAEVRTAFERTKTRETVFIPIILHAVNLRGYPFEMLLSLPRIGPSVSSWPQRMDVWAQIDWELRQVIEGYQRRDANSGGL